MADPGWYPDPAGGPGQRWFDGRQWTDSTLGGGAAPPPPGADGTSLPAGTTTPPPPTPPPPGGAWPAQAAALANQRRPRGGPTMALLGLVAAVLGLVVVIPGCIDQFSGPRFDIPGQATIDLDDGSWTVHQRVDGSPRLFVSDLAVTGDGVRLESLGISETLTINETEYTGIARLVVDGSGPITLGTRAAGEPSSARYSSELLVTRGFSGFGRLFLFGSVGTVGTLLGVIGLARWRKARRIDRFREANGSSSIG